MEKLLLEISTLPFYAIWTIENPIKRIGQTVDVANMNAQMDLVSFLRQIEAEWIIQAHLSNNALEQVHLPLGERRETKEHFYQSGWY